MAEPISFEGMAVGLRAGRYINWGDVPSTAPTTGLVKGDMMVVWSAASTPVLGMVTSTAGNTVKYISPFDSKTLGRASV